MGKKRKVTSEDIAQVVELYTAGRTYDEISQIVGVGCGNIPNILRYGGIEINRRTTKKTNADVRCPKCRKAVSVDGARFCPFCGADIRSERQIVAEELEKVLGVICDMNVPAEEKDRACNTLRNAIRLLKGDKVE